MRCVFLKEWRQGHLIVVFGLLMGGLITALWGGLTTAYAREWRHQEAVDAFCGILYVTVPIVLAAFVGSGLVAAEVERDTMPLLLALPFSRRQVWLGKLAAGLLLFAGASLLVVVPGAIAVRPALESVSFYSLLPEFIVGSVVLFCIAFFWSAVCASITSALLSTVVLMIALVIGVAVLLSLLGGRLLGYGPLIDADIWMLAACPALVLGSYVGFVRGETFRAPRRWLGPLLVAALAFVVLALAMAGLVRRATRYDRSKVERISQARVTGGGAVLSAYTSAGPVRAPDRFEEGWLEHRSDEYRRNYALALDLDTGREVIVRRETAPPAVSPDGRLAAFLSGPRPLTWRGDSGGLPSRTIEIWDLEEQRLVYRGVPRALLGDRVPNLVEVVWSPDGSWLAAVTSTGYRGTYAYDSRSLVVMQSDGSGARTLEIYAPWHTSALWDWDSSSQAIYAVKVDGRLVRYDVESGEATTVWQPVPGQDVPPDGVIVRGGSLVVSPSGDAVAVAVETIPGRSDRGASATRPLDVGVIAVPFDAPDRFYEFAVAVDGSRAQLVHRSRTYSVADAGAAHVAWSRDGQVLCLTRVIPSADRPGAKYRAEVVVWRKWDEDSVTTMLPGDGRDLWDLQVAPLADSRLLIWSWDNLWSVDYEQGLRPIAREQLARTLRGQRVIGVDRRGRAILQKLGIEGPAIAAADLGTGELTRIFP